MFEPGPRQPFISLGNETFDQFLGGGFLNTSVNLFERQGPTSRLLDAVWIKSFASTTLTSKSNLLVVNFNTLDELQPDRFLAGLPVPRKVKSEILYKDVRGKSATAKIKIAWRYSSRSASPADKLAETKQVDFGLQLSKEFDQEKIGKIGIINVDTEVTLGNLLAEISKESTRLSENSESTNQTTPVNIIIKDLLHPHSPIVDKPQKLLKFLYMLRCFARVLQKGAILVSYDTNMCVEHSKIKQNIYNLVDCVVSFFTYETGQNLLLGYKHTEGTLDYVKVAKINSFGLHFQRELSDWGYRFTKNHRYFVVDELSLPPCHDDDDDDNNESKRPLGGGVRKQSASDLTNIGFREKKLEQVGPLDELREAAMNLIGK